MALASVTAISACARRQEAARPHFEGVVWQPSRVTLHPNGNWQLLGARSLLVQWSAVDGSSFLEGVGLPTVGADMPDWTRIAAEPWAQNVILGLAGIHDETRARASLSTLASQSHALAQAAAALPLQICGWYFPVEVDPTWKNPQGLKSALEDLPRPLWISAYDSANLGPQTLADWIEHWVPSDVGVFFQDGVGVHARVPAVARTYLEHLTQRLGWARVRVIAEAFRPAAGSGFRSALADELLPQILAYTEWPIYAFDGPHYLHTQLVSDLLARGVGQD
jgi:hypothetical protein